MLKRRVRTGRGIVKEDANGSFLRPNNPTAIMCISTKEKIVELCTIGQNFPPVSYLASYTFRSCNTHTQKVKFHSTTIKLLLNKWIQKVTTKCILDVTLVSCLELETLLSVLYNAIREFRKELFTHKVRIHNRKDV